jgi:hypothetical protein
MKTVQKYFADLVLGISVLSVFLLVSLSSAEVYKYTDQDGTVSYADSIDAVPQKYRKTATVVEGLREPTLSVQDGSKPADKEAKAAEKRSKTDAAKAGAKGFLNDFIEKDYWKPVALFIGLIVVYQLVGKLGRTMGGGPLWTSIKLVIVAGFLVGAFYIYSKEMSGMFDSILNNVFGITRKVETMKTNVNKNPGENQ